MKLTVLGVNGPYPAPGGACSGYLLESENHQTKILLDCGPGVLARFLERATLTELSAVVLSHLHYDHFSDMMALGYALKFAGRETQLPVYLPEGPEKNRALLDDEHFDLRDAAAGQIGSLCVRFQRVTHPVPTNAVEVSENGRRLVFTGDTNADENLPAFAANCDLLLADAGLSQADWTERAPHLSANMCGELARACGARRLLLTHFAPRYRVPALLWEAREAFPGAEAAVPGQTYAP